MNVAAAPLNATAVAPVKLVPVIATVVAGGPLPGVKLVIVGAAAGTVTVKFADEVAVPAPVTTDIFPVVAPVGTDAVICVGLPTEKLAATPLKEMAVVPVRFVPVMVTVVET